MIVTAYALDGEQSLALSNLLSQNRMDAFFDNDNSLVWIDESIDIRQFQELVPATIEGACPECAAIAWTAVIGGAEIHYHCDCVVITPECQGDNHDMCPSDPAYITPSYSDEELFCECACWCHEDTERMEDI